MWVKLFLWTNMFWEQWLWNFGWAQWNYIFEWYCLVEGEQINMTKKGNKNTFKWYGSGQRIFENNINKYKRKKGRYLEKCLNWLQKKCLNTNATVI